MWQGAEPRLRSDMEGYHIYRALSLYIVMYALRLFKFINNCISSKTPRNPAKGCSIVHYVFLNPDNCLCPDILTCRPLCSHLPPAQWTVPTQRLRCTARPIALTPRRELTRELTTTLHWQHNLPHPGGCLSAKRGCRCVQNCASDGWPWVCVFVRSERCDIYSIIKLHRRRLGPVVQHRGRLGRPWLGGQSADTESLVPCLVARGAAVSAVSRTFNLHFPMSERNMF